MTHRKRAFLIAIVAATVAGWFLFQFPSFKVRRLVWHVPQAELRSYAALVSRNGVLAASSSIEMDDWHPGFAKAGVKEVRPYIDGILIVLNQGTRSQTGVFVPIADEPDSAPYDGSGIEFEDIGQGIFSFEEEARQPFAP
jgi:hypothetical protein